jgi:hypothetical protein
MEMTIPLSQFGMIQSSMRTRFSFLVMHLDSLRERNFFYRGEVPFRVGPRRTYEVLTPVVRAMDDEPVLFRLLNISRDGYEGNITIVDSAAERVSKHAALPVKDYVLVDTLRLRLRRPLPPGDYPMTLALSGGTEERFIARSFEALTDPRARIGLVTGLEESPVAWGMKRLRLPWKRLDEPVGMAKDLLSLNVVVLDREAVAGVRWLENVAAPMREWVRGGGHLVILPQSGAARGGTSVVTGASFRNFPQLSPETPVQTDTSQSILMTPNRITDGDWEEWVVARSLGSINIAANQPAQVVVKTRNENAPLVVEVPEGKGRITFVALDLVSQLMNVHPGAHRILANILRP